MFSRAASAQHALVTKLGLKVAGPYAAAVFGVRRAMRGVAGRVEAVDRYVRNSGNVAVRSAATSRANAASASRFRAATYYAEHFAMLAATVPFGMSALYALAPDSSAPTMQQWTTLTTRYLDLLQRDLSNVGVFYGPRTVRPSYDDLAFASHRAAINTQMVRILERSLAGTRHLDTATLADPRYRHFFSALFHWMGFLDPEVGDAWPFLKELIFYGAGAAMERQAIPPVTTELRRHAQRDARAPQNIVELQSGSGCFTRQLADALLWNRSDATITGIELSPVMCATAARRLRAYPNVTVQEGDATNLAEIADASCAVVVSINNFHELRKKDRERVMREARRIVQPGGIFVVIDAAQDRTAFGALLDGFAKQLNEPHVLDYLDTPLAALALDAGWRVEETATPLFLAERHVFRRPA